LRFTFRQNARKGGDETDALYFLEAGDPGSEFGGEFDFCSDKNLDFGFLLFLARSEGRHRPDPEGI